MRKVENDFFFIFFTMPKTLVFWGETHIEEIGEKQKPRHQRLGQASGGAARITKG